MLLYYVYRANVYRVKLLYLLNFCFGVREICFINNVNEKVLIELSSRNSNKGRKRKRELSKDIEKMYN